VGGGRKCGESSVGQRVSGRESVEESIVQESSVRERGVATKMNYDVWF
jgi:hypothetical protein